MLQKMPAEDEEDADPPDPVDLEVDPAPQRQLGEDQRDHLAHGEHRQRPARQQLEVPADRGPGEHREPVDDRVEQRAHARVLARGPGEEAVEVVAGGDRQVEQRAAAVARRRRSRRRARRKTGIAASRR